MELEVLNARIGEEYCETWFEYIKVIVLCWSLLDRRCRRDINVVRYYGLGPPES